jgi:hypothetical protein
MMGELQEALEHYEDEEGEEEEATALRTMFADSLASSATSAVSVIATVPGTAHLRVALELQQPWLLATNLDMEATALFRVQRILKTGDRYAVGDPMSGFSPELPPKIRKDLLAAIQSIDDNDLEELGIRNFYISPPGFVGIPVAIYN